MKFAKSLDLKLLYQFAKVNSPSRTIIIDMQKETSHMHRELSMGNKLLKTPYYLYYINMRIEMEYICLLKPEHTLKVYSLSLCLTN